MVLTGVLFTVHIIVSIVVAGVGLLLLLTEEKLEEREKAVVILKMAAFWEVMFYFKIKESVDKLNEDRRKRVESEEREELQRLMNKEKYPDKPWLW